MEINGITLALLLSLSLSLSLALSLSLSLFFLSLALCLALSFSLAPWLFRALAGFIHPSIPPPIYLSIQVLCICLSIYRLDTGPYIPQLCRPGAECRTFSPSHCSAAEWQLVRTFPNPGSRREGEEEEE